MSLALTSQQVDLMKQAVRDGNYYRTSPSNVVWNDLWKKGFADKIPAITRGKSTFRVTAKGRQALAKFMGIGDIS